MFLIFERYIILAISILGFIDLALINIKGIRIDAAGYALSALCGVVLICVGRFYRLHRPKLRVSHALCGAGFFILFSIVGSIFNYMFLPIVFEPIDPILMRIDEALGYHWPSVVTFAATFPWIGYVLFAVYATSLPQLLLLVCWHGFSGDETRLSHFLLTGMFGAMTAIVFWILFPTFGAKAYHTLPQWVMDTIPLAVDPAYGRELLRLAQEGVEYLTPKDVLGLIAFPSFHVVMACMSIAFAPRYLPVRLAFYAVNAVMFPAVLVQGGHHLIDIAGGVCAFAFAYWMAGQVLRQIEEMEEAAPQPTA